MKRKLTNSQKNNENERRANKENLEPSSPDFSSATIPNNNPNYSTNLFQCFEDLLSENSPTISSMMDNTEVKTTFGTSVLDKYRQKGFLADAESSQKCWDFSCVPERVLRISLPNVEVSGNAPTNWVHVKIFKENMGQMKFHQLIILSIWEMRRVLSSLDEVLGEAKRWFLNFLESQVSLKREEMDTRQFQLVNYPTPLEDRESCDKFWELCETARRKVCASLTAYDRGNFNRSYIQLKLFTRSGVADSFIRRGVVNIRVGEIEKLLKAHVEIMEILVRETLHNNKKLTKSTSLPTSYV